MSPREISSSSGTTPRSIVSATITVTQSASAGAGLRGDASANPAGVMSGHDLEAAVAAILFDSSPTIPASPSVSCDPAHRALQPLTSRQRRDLASTVVAPHANSGTRSSPMTTSPASPTTVHPRSTRTSCRGPNPVWQTPGGSGGSRTAGCPHAVDRVAVFGPLSCRGRTERLREAVPRRALLPRRCRNRRPGHLHGQSHDGEDRRRAQGARQQRGVGHV